MGPKLSPTFYNRDFTTRLISPALSWQIDAYSHDAIGGPDRATLTAHGSINSLWELVELLRCPIEILDQFNQPVWWGYVAEVNLRVHALQVGISLQHMANKVAVAYSLVDAGGKTIGIRQTTAYSSDTESTSTYGTKELLENLTQATATQAAAARDAILAERKWPVATLRSEPPLAAPAAELACRGWWHSLEWRYYAQAGTVSTETTQQIKALVTAVGEFLTGTDIVNASGVFSSQYRDGDQPALHVAEELLKSGTTNSRRLLAKVRPSRTLEVYEEPVFAERYYLRSDVQIFDQTLPVPRYKCPVAIWTHLADVIPATADITKLANPNKAFIEHSEYIPTTDELLITARSVPSPFETIDSLLTMLNHIRATLITLLRLQAPAKPPPTPPGEQSLRLSAKGRRRPKKKT